MIEDKDHIDDIFKESSEQQSFKVPESFLEDINNKLDVLDKKKKRIGRFWWLALIPVLMVIAYALWPNNNQTKKIELLTDNNTVKSSKQEEGLNDSIQLKESLTISSEDSLSQNMIKESASASNIVVNSAENSKTLSAFLQEGGKVIGDISEQDKPLWLREELKKQEKSNGLTSKNESEIVEPETKEEAFTNSNLEKVTESRISNISATENVQNKEEGISTIVDDVSTNADDVSNDVDGVSTNSDSENTTITERIEETNSSQIDTVLVRDETIESDTIVKGTEENVATRENSKLNSDSISTLPGGKNSNERSHEIQVFGSLTGSYSKLSLAGVPDEFSMTQMEDPLQVSLQFGAGYNFNFNNYSLGTGLLYQKTGEAVNYETNSIDVQDSVYVSGFYLDTIFNPNTQTWDTVEMVIYDTIGVDVIVGQSFIGKNRFNWISIPLNFGYRMNLGNFTFIPRVGAGFDFGIGKNNGIYAELIDQGLIEHQANRFVLSYSLQFEIRRNFERFHIFVNPYFKSNITPVISSQVQTRKYNSWGLNAGIGISL